MQPTTEQVSAVRAFNRFYTQRLGVLEQRFLKSPYSLTEARVLHQLAQNPAVTAKDIGSALGLDGGYLSRILQAFEDKGLITRKPSPADRRHYQLDLTAKGRLAAGQLDHSSHDDIAAMLAKLSSSEGQSVVSAMAAIERLLKRSESPVITLRSPRPGDIGWVVQSHGALYAREFGFDATFEALVAEIAGAFLKSFDTTRERCWIAEMDGAQVGSVFLVRHSDAMAKLRLLLVDPAARGHGLGRRLVDEAITFARQCGYRSMALWTQSNLATARKIYQDAGFVLVATEKHRSFGQDLTGETWKLTL